jgi:hypothetical protein
VALEHGAGTLFHRTEASPTAHGDASARPRTSATPAAGASRPVGKPGATGGAPASAVPRSKSQAVLGSANGADSSTAATLGGGSGGSAATTLLHPYLNVDSAVALGGVPRGRRIRLNFLTTWGDLHYLGLTGLEVRCCLCRHCCLAAEVGVYVCPRSVLRPRRID